MEIARDRLKGVVVFAVLMENNEGIIGKSPRYIMEKLNAALGMNNPEGLLDSNNMQLFEDWVSMWLKEETKNA